jgi:hypothetical protein
LGRTRRVWCNRREGRLLRLRSGDGRRLPHRQVEMSRLVRGSHLALQGQRTTKARSRNRHKSEIGTTTICGKRVEFFSDDVCRFRILTRSPSCCRAMGLLFSKVFSSLFGNKEVSSVRTSIGKRERGDEQRSAASEPGRARG